MNLIAKLRSGLLTRHRGSARRARAAACELLRLALAAASAPALAWGPEGHAIVAEIAQHRLTPATTTVVAQLLGYNVSLASVASWADDERARRPETGNWHFVDIPLAAKDYEAARDCWPRDHGDCILKELERVQSELRCAPTLERRRDALRFAIHLIGDLHQPLHTVGDAKGGNQIPVHGIVYGNTCRNHCELGADSQNLHALWDTGLIRRTVWDWGAYVQKLEDGRLRAPVAPELSAGTVLDWALQTHAVAQTIWNDLVLPADGTIDDAYFQRAVAVLDQQLALGGLRLARFLNEALAPNRCERP